MNTEPGDRTLEEIIDELASVFHEAGTAREVAERAGFLVAELPVFDTPLVFWSRVVRAVAGGKTLGGVQAILEQAAKVVPGNSFFASGGSAPAQALAPSEQRRGHLIDNRGAAIGQQIVIEGNATFGAMKVGAPLPVEDQDEPG